MIRFGICLAAIGLLSAAVESQPLSERYREIGNMYVIQSGAAMFPHPKRESVYSYNGKQFPAGIHYRDSSAAIFVPKGFHPGAATDLVFYFHGWMNNIDSTFAQYRIAEQFAASGVNAILVHPEGPKNAPDSFGGKLEEAGVFRALTAEVLTFLVKQRVIPSAKIGRIILAGHSGAYRVMSYILLRGGLTKQIQEVYLFDALYGQTEKFAHWIEHSRGKFVDIHTPDGGTRQESVGLMEDLAAWNIPYFAVAESSLTRAELRSHRLLFIASERSHNEVISANDQFRTYLETSCLRQK